MTLNEIRTRLKDTLPIDRYIHAEGTAQVARMLADKLGLDLDKAEIAGLLHDCGKYMTIGEQIAFARTHGISLSEADLRSTGVIHSRIGAFIAQAEYDITDPEIIEAIYNHTAGAAGLGDLARVIYAADILDPNRNLEGTKKMTRKALADFETTLLKLIRQNIKYVIRLRLPLHPLCVDFYNDQLARVLALPASEEPDEEEDEHQTNEDF